MIKSFRHKGLEAFFEFIEGEAYVVDYDDYH